MRVKGMLGHWATLLALLLGACATQPHVAVAPPPAHPAPLSFGSARETAVACARQARFDVAAFVSCSEDRVTLTPRQQALVECAMATKASQGFAECAAPKLGIVLGRDQLRTTDCALHSGGVASKFLSCAGYVAGGKDLTAMHRLVLDCAATANDDALKFAACNADKMYGGHATREQKIALDCAAQSGVDYGAFTACAGANLFNIRLDPDQTIAVECVVASLGEPHAAAGCIATRFIKEQLKLCAAKGYGGAHGCFGDDSVIGRNGWAVTDYRRIAAASGERWAQLEARWAENGWMQRARQWWTGTGKFVHDPRAYWAARRAAVTAPAPTSD